MRCLNMHYCLKLLFAAGLLLVGIFVIRLCPDERTLPGQLAAKASATGCVFAVHVVNSTPQPIHDPIPHSNAFGQQSVVRILSRFG